MFLNFFYDLRKSNIPVSLTSLITLHKALSSGAICNLEDFYIIGRCILVKNEKYFDIFDRIFIYNFKNADLPLFNRDNINNIAKKLVEEWLEKSYIKDKKVKVKKLKNLNPKELIEYFKKHLIKQKKKHSRGSKWIGTKGTSPVGNSGYHKKGMRIKGVSTNKSAIKVALERRFKNYDSKKTITPNMIGTALKKLKNLIPIGPKDQINIRKSIEETAKNCGDIVLEFDQQIKNQFKVILLIDNGGWSMEPYVSVVRDLFNYAKFQFSNLETYFFHNTIYNKVWEDQNRKLKPISIEEIARKKDNSRMFIIGDASMAPYELISRNGSIYTDFDKNSNLSSIESLNFLSKSFSHSVWLNPIPKKLWNINKTISIVKQIFPMFELSINGLDEAVRYLTSQ